MFSIIVPLFVTTVAVILAEPYPMSNMNEDNSNFVPQIPPIMQSNPYPMSQMFFPRPQPISPFLSVPMMQRYSYQNQVMPIPTDPISQQLNMLVQSATNRLRMLLSIQSMISQMNSFGDSSMKTMNSPPTPPLYPLPLIPLYNQQPHSQTEVQQTLQNEILQQQQNKADEQQQVMEEYRNEQPENEYINNQQELSEQLVDTADLENEQNDRERRIIEEEKEIENERYKIEQELLREEQQQRERLEREKKIREKAELRLKKIEEQKNKRHQLEKSMSIKTEPKKVRQRPINKINEEDNNTTIQSPKKLLTKQKSTLKTV